MNLLDFWYEMTSIKPTTDPESGEPGGVSPRTPLASNSGADAARFTKRSAMTLRRRCPDCMWLLMVCGLMLTGCRMTSPPPPTGLPKKLAVENDHLTIRTDVKLPKDHPLLRDLDSLRDEIADSLHLPVQKQPVTVYLFANEERYADYIQTRYPLLPPRRAYFVGTSKELAVYTFWGEKIQEDLRHEYTHGVLHASLQDVPLWLDEGLAEYYEVASQPAGLNRDYAAQLASGLAQGWRPNLDRLESLEEVGDMQKADYQESWAWVHFLLHHSDETRAVLIGYLHELRSSAKPGLLSQRLRADLPRVEERFTAHTASLSGGLVTVSGESTAERSPRHAIKK